MARQLSNEAKNSLFSINANAEVWLVLLSLRGSTGVFNVVNNNEDIESNGTTYYAYPFDIALPPDSLQKQPTVSLRIDNVDQSLTDWIRREFDPPTVELKIVLASDPDKVEISLDFLKLVNANWDAFTITGTLQVDDVFNAAFPSVGQTYTPPQFPGLF